MEHQLRSSTSSADEPDAVAASLVTMNSPARDAPLLAELLVLAGQNCQDAGTAGDAGDVIRARWRNRGVRPRLGSVQEDIRYPARPANDVVHLIADWPENGVAVGRGSSRPRRHRHGRSAWCHRRDRGHRRQRVLGSSAI